MGRSRTNLVSAAVLTLIALFVLWFGGANQQFASFGSVSGAAETRVAGSGGGSFDQPAAGSATDW